MVPGGAAQRDGAAQRGGAPWYAAALERVAAERPWTSAQERDVTEPYTYLAARPGKEVRSQLIDALAVWAPVAPARLDEVKDMVRRLHTASLLIDDVEDASPWRRGAPAAHVVLGVPSTINAANYVYMRVLADLAVWPPATYRAVLDEMVRLHRGQGLELHWRDTQTCPSEDEYVDMVLNKTGGLFRLALLLVRGASDAALAADVAPLMSLLGVLFQVRDDYLNVAGDGAADDVTEGKFSFPLLHAVHASAPDRTLVRLLQLRTAEPRVKAHVLALLERTQSLAYTAAVLGALHAQAVRELARLEGVLGANPALGAILAALDVRL